MVETGGLEKENRQFANRLKIQLNPFASRQYDDAKTGTARDQAYHRGNRVIDRDVGLPSARFFSRLPRVGPLGREARFPDLGWIREGNARELNAPGAQFHF
jgi:hypothetical protein